MTGESGAEQALLILTLVVNDDVQQWFDEIRAVTVDPDRSFEALHGMTTIANLLLEAMAREVGESESEVLRAMAPTLIERVRELEQRRGDHDQSR